MSGLAQGPRLEALLAVLLRYGSRLASAVTAVGVAMTFVGGYRATGTHVLTAGIACFISLPVLRVVLMLIVFLRDRDYRFAAITALVLAIIFAGFAIGAHRLTP